MSYVSVLENEQQTSRLKSRIIFGQLVLMIIMAIGWTAAPSNIRLHYPPDLRSGGTMGIDEISESEVYVFAGYILQQLNNWKTNGEKDYQNKINLLRSYFTPSYQTDLQMDYDNRLKHGELRNRVRNWSLSSEAIYNEAFVVKLGNSWLVWLDVEIKEYVNGGVVKNLRLRLPMQVVRYDVDPESNPWGLGLNGPAGYQAQPIEIEKVK